METEKITPAQVATGNTFRNLYLLSNNALLPLLPDFLESGSPTEKAFKSLKEIEELTLTNTKQFFTSDMVFVALPSDCQKLFDDVFIPVGFLVNVKEIHRPEIHVVFIRSSKEDFFGITFLGITKFFLKVRADAFVDTLCQHISKDKVLRKEVGDTMNPDELHLFIKTAFTVRCKILLIADGEIEQVALMKDVYYNWTDVKCMHFKKYASNGNMFIAVQPSFAEVNKNPPSKKLRNTLQEKVLYTEEMHLQGVSESVLSIYSKLKTDLLTENANLKFNSQKYYISLKKEKNVAFFHFSSTKISLVVMCSDKEAKKIVKHYEVKSLSEKTQKFWNGSSCTVVIENSDHLPEVLNLLKAIVKD